MTTVISSAMSLSIMTWLVVIFKVSDMLCVFYFIFCFFLNDNIILTALALQLSAEFLFWFFWCCFVCVSLFWFYSHQFTSGAPSCKIKPWGTKGQVYIYYMHTFIMFKQSPFCVNHHLSCLTCWPGGAVGVSCAQSFLC